MKDLVSPTDPALRGLLTKIYLLTLVSSGVSIEHHPEVISNFLSSFHCLDELTAATLLSLAPLVRLSLSALASQQRSSRYVARLWNTAVEQPSPPCSNHPDSQDQQARQRSSIGGFGSLRVDLLLEQSAVHLLFKRQR